MNRRNFLGGLFAAVSVSVLSPPLPTAAVQAAFSNPATTFHGFSLAEANAAIREIYLPQVEDMFTGQSTFFVNFMKETKTAP